MNPWAGTRCVKSIPEISPEHDADSEAPAAEQRKFLRVVDWDKLQYHKKLEYPPWTRLHREWLSDYRFCSLNLHQRGLLFCMHMLAARTANRIPYDLRWISNALTTRHTAVTQTLHKLIAKGFLTEFEVPLDSREDKHLRFVSSADTTSPEGRRERGESDSNKEGTPSPVDKSISPAPSALQAAMKRVTDRMDITPSTSRRTKGHDSRSFDHLKSELLPIAIKLESNDHTYIHKLAGQRLRMTEKQCEIAVKQLIQDGKL